MAAKNLVVVESPAKAKTLGRYLGRDYEVRASVGHLVDLPKNKLGVNVDGEFEPDYEVIRGKGKVIKELKSAVAGKDRIYLAPDPDREGEAIAFHIAQHVVPKNFKGQVHRVLFNEITKAAVQAAIKNPGKIDTDKFEAQQARRVIDRLVGYQISPLLWDKVRRGLSAGRVQSVAVRLIVEREREIQGFQSLEYWQLTAQVAPKTPRDAQMFEARLVEVDGRKIDLKTLRAGAAAGADAPANGQKPFYIADEKQARELEKRFRDAREWKVAEVKKSERQRRAAPPFITSTLQQEASRKHGFQPRRTMTAAQRLYEGVDLGDAGTTGLITYMRTDSTRVSPDAQAAALAYINATFGAGYAPETPNTFKQKKGAQDAHEAIRPTSLDYPPDRVRQYLAGDELRIYTLIWNRFLASQMSPARYDQTTVDIEADGGRFRASGQVIKFDGFLRVYEEGRDTPEESEDGSGLLPELSQGQILDLRELLKSQHFTQPPPRFTQASLIRELEEQGIGRPSTYATIMSTILGREYVRQDESKRMLPTELGILVTDLLVEAFPDILNVEFTAGLEDQLDEVEAGKKGWLATTKLFYAPFRADLERARVEMRDVKREVTETELNCPTCGKKLVVKWGRNGEFVACPAYPECKFTANFSRKDDGSIELEEPEMIDEACEKCGSPMRYKFSKFGRFLGCSAYPECKNVKSANTPVPIGVPCPAVLGGCGEGEMVQKVSRRGKIFFSCDKYPKCKFALWDKPVPIACPECEAPVVVEKTTKRAGTVRRCAKEGCTYTESIDEGMVLQEGA